MRLPLVTQSEIFIVFSSFKINHKFMSTVIFSSNLITKICILVCKYSLVGQELLYCISLFSVFCCWKLKPLKAMFWTGNNRLELHFCGGTFSSILWIFSGIRMEGNVVWVLKLVKCTHTDLFILSIETKTLVNSQALSGSSTPVVATEFFKLCWC